MQHPTRDTPAAALGKTLTHMHVDVCVIVRTKRHGFIFQESVIKANLLALLVFVPVSTKFHILCSALEL